MLFVACQSHPSSLDKLQTSDREIDTLSLVGDLPKQGVYKCRFSENETDKPFVFYLLVEQNENKVEMAGLMSMTNRFFKISWSSGNFNYESEAFMGCPLPAAEFFRAYILTHTQKEFRKENGVYSRFSEPDLGYILEFKRAH